MKFLQTLTLAALAAFPAQLVAQSDCDPGEEVLTFSIITSLQGHPKGEAAMSYANAINAQLDGRYCIEVIGNSELYADDENLWQAMLDGEVHFAAPAPTKLTQFSSKLALFDLPFLFDGPLHALEFLSSDATEEFYEQLEDDGFYGLAFWSNGMRHFSATRPMRLPRDADGLTFRVQSSSPIMAAMLDTMGVTPQKMAFAEVLGGLQSGEVQGQENTFSNIDSKGFYTAQAATTETSHHYLGYMVFTTTAFLDSLDAETRAIFVDTMKLVSHERNRFAFELNQISRQNIIEDDGIVISLTDQERQAWRDAFEPIFEEFKPEIGESIVDRALEINANTNPFD